MAEIKMNIQLADLQAQYRSMKNEIDETAIKIFESGRYIGGPVLAEFERAFAEYLGSGYAIGCSSGTTAIQAALQALSVQNGDEVILPANTFIATAEAVSNAGAKPVFVDIDPERYTIAPDKLRSVISEKTKAVIVVHLFGQPADMKGILHTTREKNIKVIEDCAQSHGSIYYGLNASGEKTGSMGDFGCFSFFPAKNLGAFGDAGITVTNSSSLAEKTRMIVDHGRKAKYTHDFIGNNFRMDPLQAGLLLVKLKRLDAWNKRRREIVAKYCDALNDTPIVLPKFYKDSEPVFHLCVIRSDVRNALIEYLKGEGVQTGIHYPVPLHLQPAYKFLGYLPGDFPETEKAANEMVSIPVYPEMTDEQVDYVIDKIKRFYGAK